MTVAPNWRDRLFAPLLSERQAVWFCLASFFLIVPLAYHPALNDYLLSDSFRIVGLIDLDAALRYFAASTGYGRNEFRPLIPLSYALDHIFWGGDPFGYHLSNLLIHLASSVLMLLVFRRLTGSLLISFAAGVLFALQPAHHSRVAWIAARDSALCLLFLLGSWLAYLHGRVPRRVAEDSPVPPPRRAPWLALSGLLYALALMSYEGAIAFPAIILAMELTVFSDNSAWRVRRARLLRSTLPLLALSVVYLVWWLSLFRGAVGDYDLHASLSGIGSNFYRLHYRLFYHVQHWLGLAYLAAFIWLWRQRRPLRPLLLFAILVIWLGYLPYLHVRGFADRFSMLSVIGAALLLGLCAAGATRLASGRPRQAVLPILLVVLFSGYYAWGSHRRARQWAAAGEKAERILIQLRQMHPSFPDNATLLLDHIPAMHENAYVFPTGLRAAIRRRYNQPLPDIHYFPAAPPAGLTGQLQSSPALYHFRYLPEHGRLVQIQAPGQQPGSRQ